MNLYIYQHCPSCIRVTMLIEIKYIKNINIIILANDDVKSHIDLVGKKIVPILQLDNSKCITESLNICNYLEKNYCKNKLLPKNIDLYNNNILNEISVLSRYLTHPRQIYHYQNKQDFPDNNAIIYFKNKKEISLNKSFIKLYLDSKIYATELKELLIKFDNYIAEIYINKTENNISYDDIIIFPILRTLTIASDALEFLNNIKNYLLYMSNLCNIELYKKISYNELIKN